MYMSCISQVTAFIQFGRSVIVSVCTATWSIYVSKCGSKACEHIVEDNTVNARRACATRVTVVESVCLSVCLSAQHLTSRASVRPEIDVTY